MLTKEKCTCQYEQGHSRACPLYEEQNPDDFILEEEKGEL